jgi:hypothetical protein
MANKKKQAPKDAPAAPEKPRSIQIKSVKRTRKTIEIGWEQGDASFDLSERDNPLPSFGAALDALLPVVVAVLHLPDSYAEQIAVVGFNIGEQSDARTVNFRVEVTFDDASKTLKFTTHSRLLAHPVTPGVYTPPLPLEFVGRVEEAVEQARQYIIGERAQGQIELPEGDDDEDSNDDADGGEQLPL